MAENQKRPEATHRQRASMTAIDGQLVIGSNGSPMAIITGTASDLVPTVQFGNVMVGPVSITRWVEDDGDESVIAAAQAVQQMAEAVVGSERRIIQYAIDPSSRVINPATGADMVPTGPQQAAPAPPAPPAQPQPVAAPVSSVAQTSFS